MLETLVLSDKERFPLYPNELCLEAGPDYATIATEHGDNYETFVVDAVAAQQIIDWLTSYIKEQTNNGN